MTRAICGLLLLPLALACGDKADDSGGGTGDGGGAGDGGTGDGGVDSTPLDPSFFADSPVLVSATLVDCTLEDGSAATCHALVFDSNPVTGGPFCPETIDDVGGVGVYDGPTDPGFQLLARPLWEAMEADGYDIVNPDGTIVVEEVTTGAGGGPMMPTPGGAACLEAAADDSLRLRFLVPAEPRVAASPEPVDSVELVGVALDGAPMNGEPPSVVDNGGKIPALDPCGGHHDPVGYYHWHLGPEGADTVLDAHGITAVRCTQVDQDAAALVGFARDGYPLYGARDADGSLPADLDACRGHQGTTADFPGGVYHYHLSADAAPNLPTCLVGVAAAGSFGLE